MTVHFKLMYYSHAFAVHLPKTDSEPKGRDDTTIITLSVTLSAFVIVAVAVIICGICFALVRKKQNQKNNQDSKEQNTDTDGAHMFENDGKMKLEA